MTREVKEIDSMADYEQKLYQDRIYKTSILTPLAVALIDTPEFQRLEGIRQLAFAHMSYRSAHHTRFEHSVGTYLLVRTILRRIVQNHERFGYIHPGSLVSKRYSMYPRNFQDSKRSRLTYPEEKLDDLGDGSFQSRWRGLTEVVSIAALLHDITHVPFGHTLEDELPDFYSRHDSLGNPRLFKLLYDEKSFIARVFTSSGEWMESIGICPNGLRNHELRDLVYLILSFKEDVGGHRSFGALLEEELNRESDKKDGDAHWRRHALKKLRGLYSSFFQELVKQDEAPLFSPFMSDVIGNTICADMLDYLTRDRVNLGMDARSYDRLLRWLVIKKGTFFDLKEDHYRLCITAVKGGGGLQRRDVATDVLDLMRDRYEMAERVYYHHKKCAASAMLGRLLDLELLRDARPRDDGSVYPAPWNADEKGNGLPHVEVPPHVMHLTDFELLEYLGRSCRTAKLSKPDADDLVASEQALGEKLFLGLRHRRDFIYRTLVELDVRLLRESKWATARIDEILRGNERKNLENRLSKKAEVADGDVLIYCPHRKMQAKEVNARIELNEDKVIPLSNQRVEFVYQQELRLLEEYYQALWKVYVFVDPALYGDGSKCKIVVDELCDVLAIPRAQTYLRVRGHEFEMASGLQPGHELVRLKSVIQALGVSDLPHDVWLALLTHAVDHEPYLDWVIHPETEDKKTDDEGKRIIERLLQIVILERKLNTENGSMERGLFDREIIRKLSDAKQTLLDGGDPFPIAAKSESSHRKMAFSAYEITLVESVSMDR